LPLVQCERALLGAAILHVNEALLLKKAITPDEFRYPTHREIAHAVYRLADAGLLETPVDNFIVISDALHKSGSTINHAYLVKVVGSAALPGTHFRRIGAAWREDIRRLDMARELEEQAEALRQGVSA
jgi:replicative DNA helicase